MLGWLLREGRFIADPNELTAALGARLVAAGAPVVRLRISMRMLHPLWTGWTAIWEAGGALQRDSLTPHGLEGRATYIGSPLAHVAETRTAFRRRLEGALSEADHYLLHDLKAKGASDYLALPLGFTSGQSAALVAVTDRAGGFADADIEGFQAIAAGLSPILEVAATDGAGPGRRLPDHPFGFRDAAAAGPHRRHQGRGAGLRHRRRLMGEFGHDRRGHGLRVQQHEAGGGVDQLRRRPPRVRLTPARRQSCGAADNRG